VDNQKGTLAEDLCPVACSVGTCNSQLDLCVDKIGKIRVRGKGKKTCAQCKKKGLCQREVENEKGKFVENSCPTACSVVNSVVNCRDPPPDPCVDDTEFKYKGEKKCKWVAQPNSNGELRLEHRCNLNAKDDKDGTKLISDFCRVSCIKYLVRPVCT